MVVGALVAAVCDSLGCVAVAAAVHALLRLLIFSYWRTAPATLQACCGPRPEPAAEDKDYLFALDDSFIVCEYTVIKTRVSITGGKRRDVTDSSEFKTLVRKRMGVTGETYTQAMRYLLLAAGAAVPSAGVAAGPLPPPQRGVPRSWDPPETEFPGIVPIGTRPFGRSEQTAITITAILAYSNGFEIFLTRLRRPDARGFDEDLDPGPPGGTLVDPETFRFTVEFSDGRTVTHDGPHGRSSGRARGDTEPVEPILWSRGGGGTSHYQLMRWWVSPLPPRGPVEFICQLGTREIRGGIGADSILDAAQRSFRVWSDGEGWRFR